MGWYSVYAKGQHGYPQPEDEYLSRTYANACLRCGVHDQQVASFHVRKPNLAPHSHFAQLNWCFDTFFVSTEVADAAREEGIRGVRFMPVLEHRSGNELTGRVQLGVEVVVACAETTRLPLITCRPNNEESKWSLPGEKRYLPSTPFCGSVKHHPPTTPVIDPAAVPVGVDIFQTDEWFGSGGSAFRLTICSERFTEFVARHQFRGLSFNSVRTWGYSRRDA